MQIKELNESMTNEFLEVLQRKNYRQKTITNYKSTYNQLVDFLGNRIMLHDVKVAEVFKFFTELELKNSYKPTTFNFKVSAIKSLFNYMQLINARSDVPITNLMYKKIDKKEPKTLSKDVQKKWLKFLNKHSQGDQLIAARIQLATGMRIEEVREMDLINDLEIVNGKGYIHIQEAKGRKSRICPIFNENLTNDLEKMRESLYILGSYKLYLHQRPYQHQTKIFKEETGLYVTSHMLRATFATERYEDGMDINTIRILLGHESINTTLIYIAYRKDIYDLIA